MKTFDTDVFTDILAGRRGYPQRVQLIPVADQSIPIVVAEEMLRGELSMIRRCEQNPKADLTQAYDYLEDPFLTSVQPQSFVTRMVLTLSSSPGRPLK